MVEEVNYFDVEVSKNEDKDSACDVCDNVTYSDNDDDYVLNYDTTYKIYFKMTEMEIVLCEDCLKDLRSKIDKVLEE